MLRRQPIDDELLERVHHGDLLAFAELYRRHLPEALGYARRLTRHLASDHADDVVAEAVRKTFSALVRGSGPRTGFRPYLFTAIRRVAMAQPVNMIERGHPRLATRGAMDHDDTEEGILVQTALASLPEQWRRVLWATDALGLTPTEAASYLRTSAGAVAMMATQARDALRIAYIRHHLPNPRQPACLHAHDLIARRSVATLPPSKHAALERHLAACSKCTAVAANLERRVERWTRERSAEPCSSARSKPAGWAECAW